MKMIFNANEMVVLRAKGCQPCKIKKQEINDFLIKQQLDQDKLAKEEGFCQDGMLTLERAVVLANLQNVISIDIENNSCIIEMKPIGVRMQISQELENFLYSKFKMKTKI